MTVVEYAVLVALIVVAAIGTFRGMFGTAHRRVVGYGEAVASAEDARPR
jgi:Flp pilus assembly pilin Flp